MKPNPYTAFKFTVEIDGIITTGFTDVSGLDLTTSVDSIREGGVNDYVHKLPKWTTQTDLVLKKGLTDLELWDWYKDVVSGNNDVPGEKAQRKNVSVILQDVEKNEVMRWEFFQAYPIKWSGPILNSTTSTIAFESVTLAHNGLQNLA